MNKKVLKIFTDVHHFGESLLKSILVLVISMGALLCLGTGIFEEFKYRGFGKLYL